MEEKVMKDCKVLALCSQKGGVGKTTSCVNLAVGLAKAGKKVLVIDNDPQGSMTASLGYHNPDELPITLATILTKIVEDEPLKIICLVAVLRGCINTIIINRCRLPKLLRFMIKAMSRQGRTLSVIWIY